MFQRGAGNLLSIGTKTRNLSKGQWNLDFAGTARFGHFCDAWETCSSSRIDLALLSPAERRKERAISYKGVDPCGVEGNTVSVPNSRGSGKGSAKEQGVAVPARERLREDVTDPRGSDAIAGRPPLPSLGPQSLTCGARAPLGSSRLGDSHHRARKRNWQLPASWCATRKQLPVYRRGCKVQGSSFFRPTLLSLLPQTERKNPRRTRELSRYLESTGSCSLWRSVVSTQCSSDLGNLSQTTYLNWFIQQTFIETPITC